MAFHLNHSFACGDGVRIQFSILLPVGVVKNEKGIKYTYNMYVREGNQPFQPTIPTRSGQLGKSISLLLWWRLEPNSGTNMS